MRKIILGLTSIMLLTAFTKKLNLTNECEVKEFYKVAQLDSDVKVLTTLGELEEVEILLVPTKMEVGTYKIDITRKGSNLYKVEGTNYYIETRYCYEYITYDEVILKVEGNYGHTKGKIIFNL